jgi:hypothetical protein
MTQQGISPLYVHYIRRISHEITVFVGEISVFGYVYPPLHLLTACDADAPGTRNCCRRAGGKAGGVNIPQSQRIGPEAMAGFSMLEDNANEYDI